MPFKLPEARRAYEAGRAAVLKAAQTTLEGHRKQLLNMAHVLELADKEAQADAVRALARGPLFTQPATVPVPVPVPNSPNVPVSKPSSAPIISSDSVACRSVGGYLLPG